MSDWARRNIPGCASQGHSWPDQRFDSRPV